MMPRWMPWQWVAGGALYYAMCFAPALALGTDDPSGTCLAEYVLIATFGTAAVAHIAPQSVIVVAALHLTAGAMHLLHDEATWGDIVTSLAGIGAPILIVAFLRHWATPRLRRLTRP